MAEINESRSDGPPEKAGLLSHMVDGMKEFWAELRIGDGHLAAMGRLGLAELRNAFNPSQESVADRDIGLYGSATQGEIAQARNGPGDGPEQESFGMDDLKAAAKAKENEQGKNGPDQDRGIER